MKGNGSEQGTDVVGEFQKKGFGTQRGPGG